MTRTLFSLLIRLYPRAFRERYGGELVEFLEMELDDNTRSGLRSRYGFWFAAYSDAIRTAFRLRLRRPAVRSRPPTPRTPRGMKMDSIRQDLAFAFRTMRRKPLFTAVVLLTLALGVGANSAIFTVVSSVVLQPLPYQNPDDLVMVWEHNIPRARLTNVVSPANYFTWSEETEVFSNLSAMTETSETITGNGEPERIGAMYTTAAFFSITGVTAAIGRVFDQDDDRPGAARTVVLTNSFWRRRFNSDPGVIGRTVTIDGAQLEVIGVLPDGFDFTLPYSFNSTRGLDVWMPQQFSDEARSWRGRWLQIVGRLAPGVTIEQAQERMTILATRLSEEFPNAQQGWTVNVVKLHDQIVGDARTPLIILLGAVGFVLLIACANVANLLLSRATGRQQEIAIRTALGAGRARVLQQAVTESLVLAMVGGLLGLLMAFGTVKALLALSPANLPRLDEIGVDSGVIVFTLIVSLLTGLLFGAVPAWRISLANPRNALTSSAARAGTSMAHMRTRNMLVVAEFALSLMLLVGAGLMIRSFARLTDTGIGFDTGNLLTVQLELPSATYGSTEERVRVFDELVGRAKGFPGVTAASAITQLPLAPGGSATSFWPNDRPVPSPGEFPVADLRWIHPDYHQALGIPLMAGRLFDDRDTRDSPLSVVVSGYLAGEIWPGEDPLGKTISMGWNDTLVARVIGVVGDVRHNGPAVAPRPKLYWNHRQFQVSNAMTLVLRTAGDPLSIVNTVRADVETMDPNLPIYNVRTMESYLSDVMASARFSMLALGVFAGIAIVLACIGIFGVMSYTVNQRRREIGIRIALGARSTTVARHIVKQGSILIVTAIVIGTAGGLALSRFLQSMVFEVSPADPITFISVSLILAVVALSACCIPALRAGRVDPILALRE